MAIEKVHYMNEVSNSTVINLWNFALVYFIYFICVRFTSTQIFLLCSV